MSFRDVIKKSVIEGFSAADLPTGQMVAILIVAFAAGLYIFCIYRLINKTSLYNRSFHVSVAMMSVITAGIVVAMQSSIVISLGMVGALSIVRFRTAIKDALDLLFLFWSIGEGIICGAGLFELAAVLAFVVTAGILLFEFIPVFKKPYVLVVNSSDTDAEEEILSAVKEHSGFFRVKSRNLKKTGLDMIIEVSTKNERELLQKLTSIDSVENTALLTHEGEMRF